MTARQEQLDESLRTVLGGIVVRSLDQTPLTVEFFMVKMRYSNLMAFDSMGKILIAFDNLIKERLHDSLYSTFGVKQIEQICKLNFLLKESSQKEWRVKPEVFRLHVGLTNL